MEQSSSSSISDDGTTQHTNNNKRPFKGWISKTLITTIVHNYNTYIITINIPVILSISLTFKNAIVEASHREYDVDDNTNGNYVMAQVKRTD
jgi:hypothetical protein